MSSFYHVLTPLGWVLLIASWNAIGAWGHTLEGAALMCFTAHLAIGFVLWRLKARSHDDP
jgi:hypothetical protein